MACYVLTSFYRPYTAENSADSYKWLEGCGGITACGYSFDGSIGYNNISSLIKNQDDTYTPSLLGQDLNSPGNPTDFGNFNGAINYTGGGLYIYPFLNPDIMRVDRFEVELIANGTTYTYTETNGGITVIRPTLTSIPVGTTTTDFTSKYNTKYYIPSDNQWITRDYYFTPDTNEIQFIQNHVINLIPQFDNDGYGYNKYSRYKITFNNLDTSIAQHVERVYVRVYLKYNDDLGETNIETDGVGNNNWIKLHTSFTGYDVTNKKNLYNNMSLTCNGENVCLRPNLSNRYISYYLREKNLSVGGVATKNGKYNPYIYLNISSNPPANKYSFVGLYYNITSVEQSSGADVDFASLKQIDVTQDEYGTYKFRFGSYNDINQVGDLYLNIYAIYYGTKDIKTISQRRKRIIKAY